MIYIITWGYQNVEIQCLVEGPDPEPLLAEFRAEFRAYEDAEIAHRNLFKEKAPKYPISTNGPEFEIWKQEFNRVNDARRAHMQNFVQARSDRPEIKSFLESRGCKIIPFELRSMKV